MFCFPVTIRSEDWSYGTHTRTEDTTVYGKRTIHSFWVRFVAGAGQEANHPHRGRPSVFDAKTKQEFRKLRTAFCDRVVVEDGGIIFKYAGPEAGHRVYCQKRENVWHMLEEYEEVDDRWKRLVKRLEKDPDTGSSKFDNPPGSNLAEPGETSLGSNQAKNYTEANRKNYPDKKPEEQQIKKIVLHSTAGGTGAGQAQRTINRMASGPTIAFKDPVTLKVNPPCTDYPDGLPHGTICHPQRKTVEKPVQTSIHYAVDQSKAIVQGVLEKDIANHVLGHNGDSIGIEMTGHPLAGRYGGAGGTYARMYTEDLLDATAGLVADILKRNYLPVNRNTVVGHDELDSDRRRDPGALSGPGYWDWDDFMKRVKLKYEGKDFENYAATLGVI